MSVRSAVIERMRASGLAMFGLALAPICASGQQDGAAGSGGDELQEVVVSAQKRLERLQDVPVPVTAATADSLIEQNQLRAQDFFSSVPGLNLQFQNNRSQLAIRGITTGPVTGNPVVGYTIDDVPYGSSAGIAGLFGSAPDLDPSELARIEVLRGPQGTLYGASSIGGLVKYVTVDPSTDRISGAVSAGTHTIRGADDSLGYNVSGSINLPLGDTFAVRASAFTRQDPGYIGNVLTGVTGVNEVQLSGARLSALWRPSDALSVKLSALYQDREVSGSSNVDVRLGSRDLQNDQFGTGRSEWKHQVYSAQVTAKLGRSELTSVTAYSYNPNYDLVDFTSSPLTGALPFFYPDAGVDEFANVLRQDYSSSKFTQEVRLATPIGEKLDFLVGAFYTKETNDYDIQANAVDASNGTVVGVPILWLDSLKFSEYALFADLTVQLTDRFDVQLGARSSENEQTLHHREWTIFGGFLGRDPESKEHAVTYLLTPRFKISDNHMVYARFATGYRPGGPNAVCNDIDIPCTYSPDETKNFEVGAKGDLFSRSLAYDVSVYRIDWQNLQVTEIDESGTFNYNANASKGESKGVELSLESRPAEGLTLSVWGAFTDAKLREDFSTLATAFARAGDRLPYSSRVSGRLSAKQEFPLTGNVMADVGGSVTYVGDRKGEFVPSAALAPMRQTYPSYTQTDLHAGVEYETWRVNLFVQNVTDERGVTGGGFNNQTNYNPNWFNYIQPRTVGLALQKTF
jgi:outer membrane receptor protein involved in Fe transport